VLAIVAVCWQNAARIFGLPSFHASQVLPDSFRTRSAVRAANDLALTPPRGVQRSRYVARIPGVYPYSVVPGGIKDVSSLREAAARDRAVSRHYAHFDYGKARMVRVTEPREVYVSYRIRDTVFWTQKRIRLKIGEMLLTDGNITARAKCGNQISETAKPDVSDQEPEEDVLDQPVALEELGPSLALRPVLAPPDLPVGQPLAPALADAGFSFPYVTIAGSMAPPCSTKNGNLDNRCHPKHKKPNTPEPASMLLLASGLALVSWRYRSRQSKLAQSVSLAGTYPTCN
jgi:hypothetical protein